MGTKRPTLFHYETIDSTNDEALRLLARHAAPLFVSAARQTAGRGRMGRVWHSPEGNLYCTAAFEARVPLGELPVFTLYAALKICDALVKKTRAKLWLKWPNDLWIGGKKCAGLLAESPIVAGVGRVLLLGVGLNVNTADFPKELRARATSLRQATRKEWDLAEVRGLLSAEISGAYESFCAKDYLGELFSLWQKHEGLVGKMIRFEEAGVVERGKVLGISPSGALCVKMAKGVKQLRSGEVTLSKFL